eukprot:115303-Rhodomonas_salina.2
MTVRTRMNCGQRNSLTSWGNWLPTLKAFVAVFTKLLVSTVGKDWLSPALCTYWLEGIVWWGSMATKSLGLNSVLAVQLSTIWTIPGFSTKM